MKFKFSVLLYLLGIALLSLSVFLLSEVPYRALKYGEEAMTYYLIYSIVGLVSFSYLVFSLRTIYVYAYASSEDSSKKDNSFFLKSTFSFIFFLLFLLLTFSFIEITKDKEISSVGYKNASSIIKKYPNVKNLYKTFETKSSLNYAQFQSLIHVYSHDHLEEIRAAYKKGKSSLKTKKIESLKNAKSDFQSINDN